MGSSAIAHAASNVQEPAEQGMWGIFEVFIATLSVCSITALVILTSGVYQEDAALLAIQSGTVTSAMEMCIRDRALSTALASTIGTGSIAGVATAIFYGGPGAVFWMWVSAFLGMMTGCVETVSYTHLGLDL